MNNDSQHFLSNVAIIRPILILLMVFYHAFAIYSGGWMPLDGYPSVRVYWWLDWLSYSFMLEMFVFVSGYVFGFQVRVKGNNKLDAKNLFIGKFKRLIVPSMIFSFIYIVLLQDISQSIGKTLYDIINGVAHMWFLPMLFWCFVGVWVIEKTKLEPRIVILLLLLCSLCSYPSLPLRVGYAMYYMFFFYFGYILQRKNIKLDRFYTFSWIIGLAVAFIILFPMLTLFRESLNELLLNSDERFVAKMMKNILSNTAQIIYSFVGLSLLFTVVGYVHKNSSLSLPTWIINIGELCMGVYIFQQFILKALYNHTALPVILGPYWLPWVGFVVAISGSLLLSYLLHKTKVGRFLIG